MLTAALVAGSILALGHGARASEAGAIQWRDFSDQVFDEAKRENRFVVLYLKAVWCHWCHVMEGTTYRDPAVRDAMAKHYIPVRVDQDSRPDLSLRYEDFGWPATIIFGPDGTEIAKLRGYRQPDRFLAVLNDIVADPSPVNYGDMPAESAASAATRLPAGRKAELEEFFRKGYDAANGGWGELHKFVDAQAMEYALALAKRGDKDAERMACFTLDQSFKLIDPAWGGVYQYSDKDDWSSPHYEKIMSIQASHLALYAMAHTQWGTAEHRDAADRVYRYLVAFLTSPEGAFYVSQDADSVQGDHGRDFFALDAEGRKAKSTPRIDRNIYARENGWAIAAMAAYHDATGSKEALDRAIGAAGWITANRALDGGGFSHGATDKGGPFLGDNLAMGQAFLALYRSTADAAWLGRARKVAGFLLDRFADPATGGFFAGAPDAASGVLGKPVKSRDENIAAVRFLNLLYQTSGEARWRDAAERGFGYLASPAVIDAVDFLPGVLLAEREMQREPVHITVVGPRGDAAAAGLHAAALSYPGAYKRAEWWDPAEGKLPNHDVDYPDLGEPAAFACSNRICSVPVFEPKDLAAAVDRVMR
ncbi:MAG: thioredoxin domain-containing protein [Alphaproteobacteria bacterium]|nr:thioredoxin domain-containing protein [Alphaproteobacteria bacterium]